MQAKEKILVVEDEEDILELVRFHLLREGYDVLAADSGESALEILKTQSVDLLLLDLMLPGIDGFTVVQRVKSDADLKGVPIVSVHPIIGKFEASICCIDGNLKFIMG